MTMLSYRHHRLVFGLSQCWLLKWDDVKVPIEQRSCLNRQSRQTKSAKNSETHSDFGPLTLISAVFFEKIESSTHVVFVYKKARLCKKHQINQTIDISSQRERYPSQHFQKRQLFKKHPFPRNTHKCPPTHPILSTGAPFFGTHKKTLKKPAVFHPNNEAGPPASHVHVHGTTGRFFERASGRYEAFEGGGGFLVGGPSRLGDLQAMTSAWGG